MIAKIKHVALMGMALAVVVAIRLMLTLGSHRTVRRCIPAGRHTIAHPAMVGRNARAVAAMASLVPGASCLTQALALQFLLAVRGFATELKVGVKRGSGGAIEAHAWLLSDHRIVIGGNAAEIAEYVPIADLKMR